MLEAVGLGAPGGDAGPATLPTMIFSLRSSAGWLPGLSCVIAMSEKAPLLPPYVTNQTFSLQASPDSLPAFLRALCPLISTYH